MPSQQENLVYDISREAADRSSRPAFQEAGPKSQPATPALQGHPRIMPDFTSTGGGTAQMRSCLIVLPHAPAWCGDIIVAMEGKPVSDIYEYMNRLADFHSASAPAWRCLRDGVKVIFIVEL